MQVSYTVGAFEAKNTLGSLLDLVEAGEEIIITRHGRPVARLVPNQVGIDHEKAHAAALRIRSRAKTAGLHFHWETLKADRDAGRR